MKIVRIPLSFDLEPSKSSDCQFPEMMREQLQSVVDQAKEAGATVDWATMLVLPEETRYDTNNYNGDSETAYLTRYLHATVDGVRIEEEG